MNRCIFAFMVFIFIFLIYETGRFVGFMEALKIFEVLL